MVRMYVGTLTRLSLGNVHIKDRAIRTCREVCLVDLFMVPYSLIAVTI